MRSWLLLSLTIGCLAPLISLTRLSVSAISNMAQAPGTTFVAVLTFVLFPLFGWMLFSIWRGAVTLHPDRIVYGPWPRQKTIGGTAWSGFGKRT
jgi:hypothetical protein